MTQGRRADSDVLKEQRKVLNKRPAPLENTLTECVVPVAEHAYTKGKASIRETPQPYVSTTMTNASTKKNADAPTVTLNSVFSTPRLV